MLKDLYMQNDITISITKAHKLGLPVHYTVSFMIRALSSMHLPYNYAPWHASFLHVRTMIISVNNKVSQEVLTAKMDTIALPIEA